MPTAGTLLTRIRHHDESNIGLVSLIMSDMIFARLLAVWPSVARKLEEDGNPSENTPEALPASEHSRWLWARVEPDPEALWIEASGLPDAAHVRRAMRVLMDNGAVFPDGGVSLWVESYLRQTAKRAGVERDEVGAGAGADDE